MRRRGEKRERGERKERKREVDDEEWMWTLRSNVPALRGGKMERWRVCERDGIG
jgi:hypothetical protein